MSGALYIIGSIILAIAIGTYFNNDALGWIVLGGLFVLIGFIGCLKGWD